MQGICPNLVVDANMMQEGVRREHKRLAIFDSEVDLGGDETTTTSTAASGNNSSGNGGKNSSGTGGDSGTGKVPTVQVNVRLLGEVH